MNFRSTLHLPASLILLLAFCASVEGAEWQLSPTGTPTVYVVAEDELHDRAKDSVVSVPPRHGPSYRDEPHASEQKP